jgi:predicted transcriptional regulator YdeE
MKIGGASLPTLVEYEGSTVLGIAAVTSNAMEADPATGKIGQLWARFYRDGIPGRIPLKRAPEVPVGVYSSYKSDYNGEYELTVGMAVDASAHAPEGLVRVSIPAGTYLLFEAEGDVPQVVIDTWKEIWIYFSKPGRVRAYATDFELHRGPKSIAIYISVK